MIYTVKFFSFFYSQFLSIIADQTGRVWGSISPILAGRVIMTIRLTSRPASMTHSVFAFLCFKIGIAAEVWDPVQCDQPGLGNIDLSPILAGL